MRCQPKCDVTYIRTYGHRRRRDRVLLCRYHFLVQYNYIAIILLPEMYLKFISNRSTLVPRPSLLLSSVPMQQYNLILSWRQEIKEPSS